jgi:hypothetical protein
MDTASGFFLSILSPVWRAKLCGDSWGKGGLEGGPLALEGEDAGLFRRLLALGSGAAVTMEEGLEGVMALGLMADRYQVEVVQGTVEKAVLRLLRVESCGMVLGRSSGSGLVHLERASRELALREFDQFTWTTGFMELEEEVLGSLLEDGGLWTEKEERVFEGVVRWMKGGRKEELRGSGLLGRVRFPLMDGEYLADLLREGCGELEGLADLVGESLGLQRVELDERCRQPLTHLDERAVVERKGGVKWGCGERRLAAAARRVFSVALDERHVCGGLDGGEICVWSRSTLGLERTLAGHKDHVWALLFVRGRLVSGSADKCIRVWDVAAGRCDVVLEGHTGVVKSLALSGNWLLSGSFDETVRVWATEAVGSASSWRCEQTLSTRWELGSEGSSVLCLAVWGDKVAGGCGDEGIRVWSSETWALERILQACIAQFGCAIEVGMAVSGQRLISSFEDGMVRVWSTETWECVQTVEVYTDWSEMHVGRLAVCGSMLVGGSVNYSDPKLHQWPMNQTHYQSEVLVWDLESLRPLNTLKQLAGRKVMSLACDGEEVWAAVGKEVVVWGRRG